MVKKCVAARTPHGTAYPYTVVLLRPDYLGEVTQEQYGQDIYVALVMAGSVGQAIKAAQQEVFAVDTKDALAPVYAEDYELCVLFEGHHDPRAFGWQFR